MKLFRCDSCGNTLYFENTTCESCGHRQGYSPETNRMVALEPAGGANWRGTSEPDRSYVFCANEAHGACNWLIPAAAGGEVYCKACRHNEVVPALDDPQNLVQWQILERAKKRLFYSLLQFELPLATRAEDPDHGLSFRFLADEAAPAPVMTGHENGIITIALAEADDAEREKRRVNFHEPYRTLLGHFRHEIGHHYWDLLVDGTPNLERFRQMFGDEREDYSQALQRHYDNGPPLGWTENFVSGYATTHAWEDFAETWAHFLHITDTVEMASSFGVHLRPESDTTGGLTARLDYQPYRSTDIGELMDNWVPLASLLNNLNRAVGQPDAYPFVLTPAVVEKLGFIQRLIQDRRQQDSANRAA